MKKILVLSIFVLSLADMQGQSAISGYMGKRATVSYSIFAHPSLPGFAGFFGTNSPYDDLSINLTQAGSFEYLFAKKTSVCLGFQYSKLWLGYEDEYVARTYSGTGGLKYPALCKTKGISLGLKFYTRTRIAPVGTYFRGDLLVLFNSKYTDPHGISHMEYGEDPITHQYGNHYIPVTDKPQTSTSGGGGASIGLGRQRIFFDRLVVDSGMRFCIALSSEPGGTGYAAQFPVMERVFFSQFINYRLGIGFLAF
ncbi:MAG: hypothetical protein ACJ77K_09845 [Bacteroidia bacterium]